MSVTGPELRAVLERGFPVGDEVYPWGTTVDHVDREWTAALAALGRPAPLGTYNNSRHAIFVPLESMFGIPLIGAQLWSRAVGRPVLWVVYEVAPGRGLEGQPGFDRVRVPFDDALDEVPERYLAAQGHPSPHTVAGEWTSGTTKVHVSTSYEARKWMVDNHTTVWSSGRIRVERDEQALMQPYIDAKRNTVQPWESSPGEVEVIAAPGLRTNGPRGSADASLAARDDLYDTPQWVVDRLGPDQVAIWTHAASRTWGFGDSRLSRVIVDPASPGFLLRRALRSRGEGYASLPPAGTGPGPAGLDAAASALRRRGVEVRVEEHPDE